MAEQSRVSYNQGHYSSSMLKIEGSNLDGSILFELKNSRKMESSDKDD